MALVDTDVIIDILRGQPKAEAWFKALPEALDVPGFVAMELYQGCQNKSEAEEVSKLLRPLLVVWPSSLECHSALRQYSALKLSHSIGLLDCLIACCAIERVVPLYTFNLKHYAAYPGLTALKPYSKP